jgi:ribosomal-protein-alanine N-acetyltransferase
MTLDDAEFWLRHFSEPGIVDLTAFEAPNGIEGAREELQTYAIRLFEENKGIRWGIALKDRAELIGTLGYHQWVKGGGYHARIGYDLAPPFRQKGIMTEAMRAVLGYGFEMMGLNRVEALVDSRNVASVALLGKLGFHLDGVLRENTYFRGRFIDDAVYSLLAREWRVRA